MNRVFIYNDNKFYFLTAFDSNEDPLPYTKQVVASRNKSALIQYFNSSEHWVYTEVDKQTRSEQKKQIKQERKERKKRERKLARYKPTRKNKRARSKRYTKK